MKKISIIILLLLFLPACLPEVVPIEQAEKSTNKEIDLSLAINFCNKTGGIYQTIGNVKKCILDDKRQEDLIEYFKKECLPLEHKCIIYENNDVIVNDKTDNLKLEEFSGKIFSLSPISTYDDYILMNYNGDKIKYGIQPIIINKNYDQNIQNLINEYINTDQEVIIKGYLLANVDDVGKHRIIIEKIFLKNK